MTRGAGALGTLILFFLLLLGLGVLWVATGGPSRPISHSGPFLSQPTAPGVPLGSVTRPAEGEDLNQVNSTPASGNGQSVETKPRSPLDYFFDTRRGGSLGTPDSPYADEVDFRDGSADAERAGEEYVILRASRGLERNITITGWTVESTVHVTKVTLGTASALPFLGQVNSAVPVTIGPDSDVYIVTGRSPMGTSFRVNACTGYFEQYQDFEPRLDRDCPAPEDEALLVSHKTTGVPACIDFVERLRSCEIHTGQTPPEIGSSCRDFVINDLTYAGCVNRHKNDPDFYRSEWRLYLNRDQELWANDHEQIVLRDENGKLVAVIEY